VLGIVGAMDMPTINNFIAGFKQGVAEIDPSIKVEVRYAGTFEDPARGLELANSLFDLGADIVYNVAATTGLGVLQAAKEKGRFAIGVDINQDDFQKGHVAGSMLKRVDVSFYKVIEIFVDNKIESGAVLDYGLAEGWVGPTYSPTMLEIVPEDIIKVMKEKEEEIISGKLKVNSTR
jgi:basic membrane protein A